MKIQDIITDHMLSHLINLAKNELKLDTIPKIKLITTQAAIGDGTSFGEFDGDSIKIVVKGRHPMDIMRTLAHELVHWKQQTAGHTLDGTTGSKTENQANSLAGVIMRKFAKLYPEYFLDSIH